MFIVLHNLLLDYHNSDEIFGEYENDDDNRLRVTKSLFCLLHNVSNDICSTQFKLPHCSIVIDTTCYLLQQNPIDLSYKPYV